MSFIKIYYHPDKPGDVLTLEEVRELLPPVLKDVTLEENHGFVCLIAPEEMTWLEMVPAYILPLQKAGFETDEDISLSLEQTLREKYPDLFINC